MTKKPVVDTAAEKQERKDLEKLYESGERTFQRDSATAVVETAKDRLVGALNSLKHDIQSLKALLAQGSKSDLDGIGAHLDELISQVDAAIGAAQ